MVGQSDNEKNIEDMYNCLDRIQTDGQMPDISGFGNLQTANW